MDTAQLKAYLDGARVRTQDRNRMVSSAAAQSVSMIESELKRRGDQTLYSIIKDGTVCR